MKSELEIVLSSGICTKEENSYVCRLPVSMRISVECGDILGIELPRRRNANFELYSVSEPVLTSYIFKRDFISTIDLSNTNETALLQPLIRLRVNSGGI